MCEVQKKVFNNETKATSKQTIEHTENDSLYVPNFMRNVTDKCLLQSQRVRVGYYQISNNASCHN
jgi:hypothetical protein